MNWKALALSFTLLSLALCACSSDALKRAAYEASYQKGCMDRTATPQCDPAHKSYDEYGKDREQLIKPDSR